MNKETIQSYNERLTTNNTSLNDILSTVSELPEIVETKLQDKSITITKNGTQNITYDEGYDGLNSVEVTTNIEGSSTKITNLVELDNAIIGCVDGLYNYYDECVNNYECDSNEPITLYTPAEGFNYYLTRYRNGTYQVLWFRDRIIKERSSPPSTLNTRAIQTYAFNVDHNSVGVSNYSNPIWFDSNSDAYLSPTYSTLQELIDAMQDNTTVYTSANNSGWGVESQSPTLAPYTNMAYLDYLDNIVMRKRLSSNEKIEVQ